MLCFCFKGLNSISLFHKDLSMNTKLDSTSKVFLTLFGAV
ncbi:hypothetical protein J530_2001, partial [Acinetobacter baumannii 15827]